MELYLEFEYPHILKCLDCNGAPDELYRCRDCSGGSMLCKDCVVQGHRRTPFHHLEKWHSGHFSRISLGELGLDLYCGHGGSRCHRSTGLLTHKMQIVDGNGTFQFVVYECECEESAGSFAEQLFASGLFPATHKRPKTAFTFQCLKDFQTMNFTAKVSLWDYFTGVKRRSNGVQPHTVKVSSAVAGDALSSADLPFLVLVQAVSCGNPAMEASASNEACRKVENTGHSLRGACGKVPKLCPCGC